LRQARRKPIEPHHAAYQGDPVSQFVELLWLTFLAQTAPASTQKFLAMAMLKWRVGLRYFFGD
jgi:hypothetical protein